MGGGTVAYETNRKQKNNLAIIQEKESQVSGKKGGNHRSNN